jgi:hypothetical protein
MSIHGYGSVLGFDATYTSTGVFTRMPSGVLMEEGNGLISTNDRDVAVVKFTRICVSVGKGRTATFRNPPLIRHNRIN